MTIIFATKLCSGDNRNPVPSITLTGPDSVQGVSPPGQKILAWKKMAQEVEDSTYQAKMRKMKKKTKKAKVTLN